MNSSEVNQMHNSSDTGDDNFDEDDLIPFQLDSKPIKLYYSQLVKYSKLVRDGYLFSAASKHFPEEIHKFLEDFQLSHETFVYFSQLLNQNCVIDENSSITYKECTDLLTITEYLKIRKLSFKIDEYIENRNDVDFIIDMILHELNTQKKSQESGIEIKQRIERLLTSKIDECFTNDKFSELPISVIHRIVTKSSKEKIDSNKLFDFIKKSISKYCILFQFIDLQKLSEDRLIEMCDIYSKSDETSRLNFDYMGCNLSTIREMIDQLKKSAEMNEEQNKSMKELQIKIELLQNQFANFEQENKELKEKLTDSQEKNAKQNSNMKELETKMASLQKQFSEQNEELKNQLSDSEKAKNEMYQKNELQMSKMKELENQISELMKVKEEIQQKKKKELFPIKGEIKAKVRNGLLVSAHIKLALNGESIDQTRCKYIISKSDAETVGHAAYEKGESITSLEMETVEFLVKQGTYTVRCIVFDSVGESYEIVSNTVKASGESVLFRYTREPSIISLCESQYKLEVWGAKGGDSIGKGDCSRTNWQKIEGGLGGYSRGVLHLDRWETVHVVVGGQGRTANSNDGDTTDGGYPDGGGTKTGHHVNIYPTVPGTGGGSTSIRIGSDSDHSRVIVAGGGGGASGDHSHVSPGGFGGGQSGGNGVYCESLYNEGAGTQTGSTRCHGYNNESYGEAGKFGHGAPGGYRNERDSGGGGGGGWYGGGSGGFGWGYECSSGGGGSGWIFTEQSLSAWRSGDSANASQCHLRSSFYLTDAATFSGNEEFPCPDRNGTEQGHRGDGFAKITPQ